MACKHCLLVPQALFHLFWKANGYKKIQTTYIGFPLPSSSLGFEPTWNTLATLGYLWGHGVGLCTLPTLSSQGLWIGWQLCHIFPKTSASAYPSILFWPYIDAWHHLHSSLCRVSVFWGHPAVLRAYLRFCA